MTTAAPTTRTDPPVGGNPEPPAIELSRVGKKFDETWVIRDLEFEVGRGQIVGLIGPSGCGKTTTVRMINGTYRPDEGTLTTFGRSPWQLPRRQRQRLGYLPQQPVLFEALQVWENLHFHASLNGVRLRRSARLREALELVDLAGHEHKLVSECSGGMKRRLALAATLLHHPDIVVLDEPTAGIDPILRARLWDHFRALAAEGTTLLVTTQYVNEAAHCDLVGLLTNGAMLHFASPTELRRAAYGGEPFTITTGRLLTAEELAAAGRLVDVSAPLVQGNDLVVAGVVPDAGQAITSLLSWMSEHGIEVVDSEEVVVDYEQMFVRLVERDDESATTPVGEPREAVAVP